MDECNHPVEWRLDLAREIAQRLRRYPGLQVILVGGSVARGYADEYSDLEMPLAWEALPPDDLRLAIAADLKAEFLVPFNGPALEDNLLIHGFQVDFWHNTVAGEDAVIQRVLGGFSTDLGDSNWLDTVRAGIPLFGEAIVQGWKEQASRYPEALAQRVVQEALDEMQASHLELLARRGDLTLLYAGISDLQKGLFRVLLALNRRYFPSYKWMARSLGDLGLKPADVAARFNAAYSLAPLEAARDTARLVEETLRLVALQFPQIDIELVRGRLRAARLVHPRPVRLE